MKIFKFISLFLLCCGFFSFSGCQQAQISEGGQLMDFDGNSGLKRYLGEEPSVRKISEWDSRFGEGLVIETNNYRIYTTLREPLMLRQVPGFMESAYKAYQQQLPEKIDSESLFDVYLFANRQQWEKYTIDFAKPYSDIYMKIDRGAYYLNGACVAYNIGRTQTFSVLGHEGWHQFSSRHFKYRLPSWLDEGIAMHFEQSEYRSGFFEFSPEKNLNRLGTLKLAIMQGQLLPIQQIISTNPGYMLIHGGSQKSAYYYAQMYSLVRFLQEANYSKRLIPYNDMLMGALEGSWPLSDYASRVASDRNVMMTGEYNAVISREIFERYIGDDFENMRQEYLNFCGKITRNILIRQK